ncbi:MAG: NAD-dependent epimerase/dehydratase family protein [Anaerolineaceae bacterium]|nr:NAD-dependent epimerase/dehydratase family protein [Anaerolineaceae bacterium]
MNLVTGATGHIGNVLVKELLKKGEKVRAFVLPGEDLSPLAGLDIELFEGNILDAESVARALIGIDFVFHLAGIISIMPGQDDMVHRVNVDGTQIIVKAARKAGVKRFVYTSSIHAFKRVPHGIVINEEIPIDPQSAIAAYDRSKAEATLAVLAETKLGLPAVIVCPTGVIGPYDYKSSELGVLIQEWMVHKVDFLIEGYYDFVDVRDVVQGAISARDRGQIGQIYILSGELIRVVDIWRMVKELVNLKSSFIQIPTRLAMFTARLAQIYYNITRSKPRFTTYSIETLRSNAVITHQKAQLSLGYQPRSLYYTLKDTVSWWKEHNLSKK